MTKLEAWKAWCDTTGTGDLLANQFTLDNSSHGKAFSYAWNVALDDTATKIAAMPFGDTAASFAVWIREQKT
jgi:hypothetical protein